MVSVESKKIAVLLSYEILRKCDMILIKRLVKILSVVKQTLNLLL